MYESIEEIFGLIVNYAVLISELAGVSVLVVTLIKAFIGFGMIRSGIWIQNIVKEEF